ncbi:hypothetical protein DUI87_04742 [Hirundo rustica rustica]|uniref:Uncharacterized protein n=1 Tax=Hirundo rustica rustica TaxID=333673 RepID=A0A3M0L1A6_HIRRU|nr:hypothetical protein DUI87_04742 [Hirundo rustica rustica]
MLSEGARLRRGQIRLRLQPLMPSSQHSPRQFLPPEGARNNLTAKRNFASCPLGAVPSRGGVEFVRARVANLSNPCHMEAQALSPVSKTATALAIRVVAMPASSLQKDELETRKMSRISVLLNLLESISSSFTNELGTNSLVEQLFGCVFKQGQIFKCLKINITLPLTMGQLKLYKFYFYLINIREDTFQYLKGYKRAGVGLWVKSWSDWTSGNGFPRELFGIIYGHQIGQCGAKCNCESL